MSNTTTATGTEFHAVTVDRPDDYGVRDDATIMWRGLNIVCVEYGGDWEDEGQKANDLVELIERKMNRKCLMAGVFPETTAEAVDLAKVVVKSLPESNDEDLDIDFYTHKLIAREWFIDAEDDIFGPMTVDIRLFHDGDVTFTHKFITSSAIAQVAQILAEIAALEVA